MNAITAEKNENQNFRPKSEFFANSCNSDENHGFSLKPKFLPSLIIKARTILMDRLSCLDLCRPAKMALWGILAFWNVKKPTEPIFPSRDKLCQEAMLGSLPTLYRALAKLETCKYIRREQIRRKSSNVYGQYSVSHIWLTDKAFALLGLVNSPKTDIFPSRKNDDIQGDTSTYPQEPSITVIDGLLMCEHTKNIQPIQEQPCTAFANQPSQAGETFAKENSKPQNHEQGQSKLPSDLQPLLSLGLSHPRIFMLMQLTRLAGIGGLLGTIVKTSWHRLKDLRGRALFAYIRTLIQQPKDWRYEAKKWTVQQHQTPHQHTKTTRYAAKLEELFQRYLGFSVLNSKQVNLGTVMSSGNSLWIDGVDSRGTTRLIPVDDSFISAWLEGRILFVASASASVA